MLARQWASTSDEEKQIWKYRAEQSRNEPFPTIPGLMPDVPGMDDGSVDDDDGVDEETGGGKRRAIKRETDTPSAAI